MRFVGLRSVQLALQLVLVLSYVMNRLQQRSLLLFELIQANALTVTIDHSALR